MNFRKSQDKPLIIAILLLILGAAAVTWAMGYVSADPPGTYRLPDSAGSTVSSSYTTYYGTFEAIDKVLERNNYMTLHPTELTAQESLWYITAEDSPEAADRVLEETANLSEKICAGLEAEYDKAYALAVWVGENIAYDFDSEDIGSDRSVICLETVLEKRRTTCGGFANLYSALCSAQGIYTLCLRGGAVSEGYTRAQLMDIPANHCWNAVLVDGEWYYSDCTWITDLSYSRGELIPGAENRKFYALMGFGEMSIEHRIDRSERRIMEAGAQYYLP